MKKMYKLSIIGILLFFLLATGASAITITHGYSFPDIQAGENTIRGLIFGVNISYGDALLKNVTINSQATCTKVFVFNLTGAPSSGFGVGNATVINNMATFNLSMKKGNKYAIGCGINGDGGTYTMSGDFVGPSWPQIKPQGNWSSAFYRPYSGDKTIIPIATASYNIVSIGIVSNKPFGDDLQNFSIFARNYVNLSNISQFFANVSGIIYSTTDGILETVLNSTAGTLANVTIFTNDGKYINRTYLNFNISQDLDSRLYQSIITFNASTKIWETEIFGGIFSTYYATSNPIWANQKPTWIYYDNPNYYHKAIRIDVNQSIFNYNIRKVFNTWMNFTAIDARNYSTINNFIINMTTMNGTSYGENQTTSIGIINFSLMSHQEYNFTITSPGYTPQYYNLALINRSHTHQFIMTTTNSYNLTFYDEQTQQRIQQNFSVELISDGQSYNYTAQGGSLFVDLIIPANYTIRYSSSSPIDYGRLREYYSILSQDSAEEIDLYAIKESNSTEITVKVYDQQSLNLIEGAIVYLQRYYVSDNSYRTVAMQKTDVGGQALFEVQYKTEYYKFRVDYPHLTQKLLTQPAYITATTINLYIDLLSDEFEEWFNEYGVFSDITYSDATGQFTAGWNDPGGVASQYCLYIKQYGRYALETINKSCSTASTGSISLGGLNTTTSNYALFTMVVGGTEKTIASSWKEFYTDPLPIGKVGPFYTFIIIVIMIFVAPLHYIALILAAIGLVISKLLGLITLSWGLVGAIVLGSIILTAIVEIFRK